MVTKNFSIPKRFKNILHLKISVSAVIFTLVLLTGGVTGGVELESPDFAYGQFFEDSETNGNVTASNPTLNSSSVENAAEVVLLSQKLKKTSSIGTKELVGQVKNIGNGTAGFVEILLTIYDKEGGVTGTKSTFPEVYDLKSGQKSTFKFLSYPDLYEGMDHYELGLKWNNVDGTEGYLENAQIHKTRQIESDEESGSDVANNILEKTDEAADEINKNAKKALNKIEDIID